MAIQPLNYYMKITHLYSISVPHNNMLRYTIIDLFNNITEQSLVHLSYLQIPHGVPVMFEKHNCVCSSEIQP